MNLHHPDVVRLYEEATQPALRRWLEDNPDRAGQLAPDEIDELLSLQGTGGPLTENGVEIFVCRIERRRDMIHKLRAICGTEWVGHVEQYLDLIYQAIQPYARRA